MQMFTIENMYKDMQKMKRGRVVPEWAHAKEIWEIVLAAGRNYKEYKQGWGVVAEETQRFVQHVHQEEWGPQDWYDAEGIQLDKANGKAKCAGIRTVSAMDPLGKTTYKRIWRTPKRRHRPPHHACGFLPGRRREAGITVQRINKWRMKKAGKDWMLTLHDVANGFPSPAHRRLNNMIRRVTPEEYNLIRHRHQRARVRMTFPGGKKKFYKIGCGTTQGD